MKKILIALALAGFACFSADAQTNKVACGAPEGKVCNKKACYKTKFAENYAVCKSDYGYFVCCETPNATNSTFPALPVAGLNPYKANNEPAYVSPDTDNGINSDLIAPQSQSYPRYSANVATSYEGYYPKKNRIKVCSNSDNVADENRAPYNGCPSPAYDGPDKNMERNRNVSTPNSTTQLSPNKGKKK
ncbi:MAG: hypothetical protein ACHQD8_07195 [Chitinophagales bacterium]